jgi:GDSL-like Lipase/Acylhydrolase family
MAATLHERAEGVLAAMHRVRAGGERFVGAFLPGASARRMRVAAVVDEWSAANLKARHGAGPLWVVLGDGASLGLGASTGDATYVRLVAAALNAQSDTALQADGPPWRVVNLAADGAGIDDVLARQLPELRALSAQQPADLVTCVVGTADVLGRPRGVEARLRALLAELPEGSVIATLPPVWSTRTSAVLNALVREEAGRRGLRVADVWDASPRRGRWCGACYQPNDVGHARWATAILAAVRGDAADRDTSAAGQA